jgi:NAD(P)-dependent dehydrogenase (short-subunit alcohol dehydrogenase family)
MFTDKVIIVTGAAGNVGSAVARLLASRGARVAAVDALGAPLTAVMETLENPSRHLPIPEVDLTDPTACERLVARVVQVLGGPCA